MALWQTIGLLVLFILASSPCCTSIPSEVFNTEKDEIQSNLAFFYELFNSNNASIGPLSNCTVLQYESSNGPLNFTLCHLACEPDTQAYSRDDVTIQN
eukprot:787506-Ditylum_brightwellii.AAC.1